LLQQRKKKGIVQFPGEGPVRQKVSNASTPQYSEKRQEINQPAMLDECSSD
jgi:hypothetical protein